MNQTLQRPKQTAFSAGPVQQPPVTGTGNAWLTSPARPLHHFASIRVTDADPLQRCACQDEKAQRKEAGQETSGQDIATADVSGVVSSGLSSGGRPLDAATRSFMEPRFGHDFSSVRIHDNAAASSSAEAVSARAYTVGNNIAFRSGEFAPGSSEGRRLLAHELTHVVQQGASGQTGPHAQRISRMASEAVQRYTLKDFSPTQATQMDTAISNANSTLAGCDYLTEIGKASILQAVNNSTYTYKKDLGLCGYSIPMTYSIKIGESAFDTGTCCKLASTVAHEASHIALRIESAAQAMECHCFGCSCPAPKVSDAENSLNGQAIVQEDAAPSSEDQPGQAVAQQDSTQDSSSESGDPQDATPQAVAQQDTTQDPDEENAAT